MNKNFSWAIFCRTDLFSLLAKGLLVVGLQEHDEEERGGDAETEQYVACQVQGRVEVGVGRSQLNFGRVKSWLRFLWCGKFDST